MRGVHKLAREYEAAETERKNKKRQTEEEWAKRELEIDKRLKLVHDVLTAAQTEEAKAEAKTELALAKEEQDNFHRTRSITKAKLYEEGREAKRKFESDMSKQRAHNKTVKGDARKRMKAALDAKKEQEGQAGPADPKATFRQQP